MSSCCRKVVVKQKFRYDFLPEVIKLILLAIMWYLLIRDGMGHIVSRVSEWGSQDFPNRLFEAVTLMLQELVLKGCPILVKGMYAIVAIILFPKLVRTIFLAFSLVIEVKDNLFLYHWRMLFNVYDGILDIETADVQWTSSLWQAIWRKGTIEVNGVGIKNLRCSRKLYAYLFKIRYRN